VTAVSNAARQVALCSAFSTAEPSVHVSSTVTSARPRSQPGDVATQYATKRAQVRRDPTVRIEGDDRSRRAGRFMLMLAMGTPLEPATVRLLGSGRMADLYAIDDAWVLRRDREGRGDAAAEAAVMAHVRAHGYPAPPVRPPASHADLVMERLDGPTMLQALTAGTLDAWTGGADARPSAARPATPYRGGARKAPASCTSTCTPTT
jgi:hypothetical protein